MSKTTAFNITNDQARQWFVIQEYHRRRKWEQNMTVGQAVRAAINYAYGRTLDGLFDPQAVERYGHLQWGAPSHRMNLYLSDDTLSKIASIKVFLILGAYDVDNHYGRPVESAVLRLAMGLYEMHIESLRPKLVRDFAHITIQDLQESLQAS